MYNVLLSVAAGVVAFGLTALVLPAIAGLIPGAVASIAVFLWLSRRTSQQIELAVKPLMGLLQARRIPEAVTLLEKVKADHGKWQPLIAGQIDSQIGMISYMQLKFDEAVPRLEAGRWRNWQATACLAAVHYRKGEKEKAWKLFDEAIVLAPSEPMAHLVPAVLRHRDGQREDALRLLGKGLEKLPGNEALEQLRGRIANKETVEVTRLPELWFQFFPEEAGKVLQMQGRRGGPGGAPAGAPVQPPAPMNRKARRSQ